MQMTIANTGPRPKDLATRPTRRQRHGRRKGATMAMLAILMPVMIGVSAMAINLVYMEMTRTELQISMDIAARAGGRTLAVTENQQQAIATVEHMLAQNPYANRVLTIDETDIDFGVSVRYSDAERYQFSAGTSPNALRIESNGTNDVPMLFPTLGVPIHHRPIKAAICTKVELDISLVIDRSGSMAWDSAGNKPGEDWAFGDRVPDDSRWLCAVVAVNGFLNVMEQSIHDERVTLTTYAGNASNELPLTNDYESIRNALDVHTNSFAGGSTGIGNGILDGVDALKHPAYAREWATRVLVVMSDGLQTTGIDELEAARLAADDRVMIYTVTFSDQADAQAMQEVAAAAAGKHYHADDSDQLNHVFQEIAKGLPTLITF